MSLELLDKLHHADCFDVFENIEDNSINLTITDIPYNQINGKSFGRDKYRGQIRKLDKGVADSSIVNIPRLIRELVRINKGSIYMFCEYGQISEILNLFRMNGLSTRIMVWEKTNPSVMNGTKLWLSGIELFVFARFPNATFNGNCRNTVLKYKTVHHTKRLHPTEKPQDLLIDLIKTSSNENDLVLDCLAGSGSTAHASITTNRNYIAIEKNKEYFMVMENRIIEIKKAQQNNSNGSIEITSEELGAHLMKCSKCREKFNEIIGHLPKVRGVK